MCGGSVEFSNFDGLDDDVVDRLILRSGWHGVEFINYLARGGVEYFTEDGVAVLEPRCCYRGDEELRTVGTRAGVCHGEFIRFVEVEFGVEFVFELVARTADTATQWIASLNHEVSDDAVEDGAVV